MTAPDQPCIDTEKTLAKKAPSTDDPKEKSAVPEEVEHWSLTTLRETLIKIGAKMVRHGRYVTF